MGARMNTKTFYVMELLEGDECLLFHRDTLPEALRAMAEQSQRDAHAALSVWDSTGGVRAMWDAENGLVMVPQLRRERVSA